MIPKPTGVRVDHRFRLNRSAAVVAQSACRPQAILLVQYLSRVANFAIPDTSSADDRRTAFELRIEFSSSLVENEGYALSVTASRLVARTADNAGLFHGV